MDIKKLSSKALFSYVGKEFKCMLGYVIMVEVKIRAMKNGPLEVIKDGKAKAWLCRCGNSNKKPHCDGTHVRVGFSAEEKIIEIE